jgi:hypothetical protein
MKKIFFCLITSSDSLEVDYNLNPNFYLEISKRFKKFYMINISQIIKNEKKKRSYQKDFLEKIPKNIRLLNFDNFADFKNYLYNKKNHKFVAFSSLGRTLNFFRILYLLKKLDFKLFILHNIGLIPTKKHAHKFNLGNYFKKQFDIFFRRKFTYFFYRLFILLNLFPKIEIFFESSKKNVNILNSYPAKKLNKFFPLINLSVYKSIYHINSRSYDELITKYHLSEQNEIVFLDSGFDHPDRIRRSRAATEAERKKYYLMIKSILLQLKKFFNKKIIFTLHPNTNEKIVKKYLKEFQLVKYKTREHILKAFLVVFHESSSALDAVFLNKKMIVLQSKTMGEYYNIRNKVYPSVLGIPAYKMENFIKIDKKKLVKDASRPNKKYLNYIKNYLVKDLKIFNYLHNKDKFKKNRTIILNQRGSEEVLNKIASDYF